MLFSSSKNHPPRICEWMFKRMSDYIYLGSLGDLEEDYRKIIYTRGIIPAGIWYLGQILAALPGYIKQYIYWRSQMFKNYLKVSLRIIKRHKGFSLINVSGLAIGMACCILIFLWVQDELSYDRHHENIDNLYRAVWEMNFGGRSRLTGSNPGPLAETLKKEYPEVKGATLMPSIGGAAFRVEDNLFRERYYNFVDPDFFTMFSFEFISGDPATALTDPNSVVITEEIAEKYFGKEDPIGKVMTMNNEADLKVTAVLKNLPDNTHIKFDLLSPLQLIYDRGQLSYDWGHHAYSAYIQLTEGTQVEEFNKKIVDLKKNFIEDTSMKLFLEPVRDIHLYSSHISDSYGQKGNITYVYIFSGLAFLILLIACINFMNLMTARSSKRAKEVGMRKVSGACRSDIISQFFCETLFLTFLAVALSLILVKSALPGFNVLARKSLEVDLLGNPYLLPGLISIMLITGFISASYPSLYISSFQPARIIKGVMQTDSRKFNLRNVLVISQFSLSVMLIIGAVALSRQVNFMITKDLGWDREHLISMKMSSQEVRGRYDVLRDELLTVPGVVNVAGSESPAAWKESRMSGLEWEGSPEDNDVQFWIDSIDPNYLETLGIEIAYGRNISKENVSDLGKAFLINEEAVRQMNIKEPLGKTFNFRREGRIVGVIKDYIFGSFHNPMMPLIMSYDPEKLRYVHVKIGPENIRKSIDAVEASWKKVNPGVPFNYDFVDDEFGYLYRTEKRIQTIFIWSAVLGIFISCLGLVGLAAYIAQQRTKEFGIRKVLGGAESGLMFLMLKDFLKWVLLANIIAWPISWFIIRMYLQNYAHKTEIGWELYLLSGLIALIAAVITVGYQAVKASRSNPVTLLRYE